MGANGMNRYLLLTSAWALTLGTWRGLVLVGAEKRPDRAVAR